MSHPYQNPGQPQYQQPVYIAQPPVYAPPPAKTAHGAAYWLFVGWWWAPMKWTGRVLLWLFLLPVGIWRSWVNHSKKKELRQRRGYRK